jgi:hypothetical protein
MKTQILLVTLVTISLVCSGLAQMTAKELPLAEPFAVANIRFEQNATDGDVEVVFEIKGGDDGLNKLTVVAPDNRIVADITAPDNSTMGIRQFRLESPEPKNVEALKAAYPAGTYKLSGETTKGLKYYSEATLNHELPATVSFLYPKPEEEDVSTENFKITWSPVKNVASYILELSQDELGVNILVQIPASSNSFSLPDNFLKAGMEYTFSIGTVTEGDNRSFVETTFTTGE